MADIQCRVDNLMMTPIPPFLSVDNATSISTKHWTQEYFPLLRRHTIFWPPTANSIDQILESGCNTTGASFIGLRNSAYPLNTSSTELMETEGDVARDLYRCILPTTLAFSSPRQNSPKL